MWDNHISASSEVSESAPCEKLNDKKRYLKTSQELDAVFASSYRAVTTQIPRSFLISTIRSDYDLLLLYNGSIT